MTHIIQHLNRRLLDVPFLLGVLCVFSLCCPQILPAANSGPLGTLIWTDFDGDWKVKFHTFHHPDLDNVPGLNLSGTVSYGDQDDPGTTVEKPPYESFSGKSNATDLLHPSFDYTGVRIFFGEGKGITHSGAGDAMSLLPPETKLFKFSKSVPPAAPFAEASGWDYPFHPVCDHKGAFILFNKFHMTESSGAMPGIHLYRTDYENPDDGTLVEEHAAYPSISVNDNLVVFVRQLANDKKLPETPLAMGVFALNIDPETGAADGEAMPLTPLLGEEFLGEVDDTADNPTPVWRGPIRCGKPTISGDEDTVIFPLQDARFGTKDPTWNLWKLSISGGSDSLEKVCGDENSDYFWPSISADGRWVAHVARLGYDKDTEAQYKILVTNLEDPTENHQPDNMGSKCMWPCFDQDNDIPNLEIRLTPGTSVKPTFIKITDVEPDEWPGGTCSDTVKMYFEGSSFVPGASEAFTPAETAELKWTKDELPAVMNLLISTNENYEGDDHKSYKSFDGHLPEYESVNGTSIEAMYLEEGSRLKIDILARDNRYLRPDSGDTNPEDFKWDSPAANYHDTSFESTHSLSGRNVDPPFFPRIAKSAIEGFYPGVSWWIEEPDGQVARGSESAFHYIFRRPNFPPSHPNYDANKPYVLRVTAQDIWLNRIDLKIPIYVWDKKADVNALGFKSNKRR